MENLNITCIISFFVAFTLALLFVPFIRKLCIKKGFFDHPNKRKLHTAPIPRLGGVAIWLCVMGAVCILYTFLQPKAPSIELIGVLIGGFVMFLLGLLDDLYNLKPKAKLIIQTFICSAVFFLGVKINNISIPFLSSVSLGMISFPLTLLWLVGITNAMNFIDGVDALAGSVGTVGSITLCIIALFQTNPNAEVAVISAVLAGALAGFLIFNFHPAKIFMGDSGSLFVGFMLASLSVIGLLKTAAMTIILPVLILVVPILDITYSTSRRLIKKGNPMTADNNHLHHKLIKAGFSHNRTTALFAIVATSSGALASFFVGASKIYFIIITVVLSFFAITAKISKMLNKIALRNLKDEEAGFEQK